MSRYLGPRLRKARALDCDLPGLTNKSRERRPQRPGQHGAARRRRPSEYALRLNEKQKLRFNYGLSEKQFRRVVEESKRSKTVTGAKILELLERRLDNVIFRAGFAPTIPAARQIVNHGHFLRNGKRLDIASARVNVGDVITLRPRSIEHPLVMQSLDAPSLLVPDWLSVKKDEKIITIKELPGADSSPVVVDVQLIVEYYARA